VDATRAALLATLNAQRAHVLGAVEGLAASDLQRPALPTGWSCVGLIQHLTLDVEQFWFRGVVAGELGDLADAASAESAWELDGSTAPEAVLAQYRDEIERANVIIESTPVESAPAAWPGDLFGDFRLPDLRAILLHVITETACHAGHLDAARELLDGRTWLVL
jgi:hypothetical protein